MPRRAAPPKREIAPDPVYGSVLVQQLINKVMLDGKKSTAEGIIYDALSFIEERTGSNPVTVLNNALENIRPRLEVRSRRVGGWPVRSLTPRITSAQASSAETIPTGWPRQTEHSRITDGDEVTKWQYR